MSSNKIYPFGEALTMVSATSKRYCIGAIKEEVSGLLEIGVISLDQPLRILCEYLPSQQWSKIEYELEKHDYLLRDHVIDLVGKLEWESD